MPLNIWCASYLVAATRDVNVLVLNFDPVMPEYGGQRLHSVVGFNNPGMLATQYEQAVFTASGGQVNYNVVEWRDLDQIPTKTDGFAYTASEYVQKWQQGGTWHSPDLANYEAILADQNVPALINDGTIDEVWMFGGPYFGFYESAMAGPRSFYINGGVYSNVPSNKPFAIMGFSYEREVAEMLHNLGHRAESSISRAFGGWNIQTPETLWDQYTANFGQTAQGPYGIGSIHYPANASSDYDYGNNRVIESTAPDWLNYPTFTGVSEQLNSSAWGGTHLGYMDYWLSHLPRAEGINPTSLRENNWWNYVFDVDAYDENGWPRGIPFPGPDGHYYLFVDAPGISWEDALDDSATHSFGGYSGHLVTVTSEQEMAFVVQLVNGREAWLAGSDAAQEDEWRWVAGPETGQVFFANGGPNGFSGFGVGEPNGGSGENALHLLHGLFWNDVSANYSNNRGFVVEFSIIPGDFNLDGTVDGRDFLAWQRNPSVGNLADWKANYGTSALNAAVSVPEPASGLLYLFSVIALVNRFLRAMRTCGENQTCTRYTKNNMKAIWR
jgi:hypothetical protein